MKAAAFLSVLSALATLFLLASSANANLAIPRIELHSQLAHEEVDIEITGDQGVVTGTFNFINKDGPFSDLTFYLPVYAKEGTPTDEFKPEVSIWGQKLDVVFVRKEWEQDPNITSFGKLPQLEGQRVYWFMIAHVPQEPQVTEGKLASSEMALKIRYTQKLSMGKFIYTPLIPKERENKDYGNITVSADRPLTLLDADKHSFEKKGDKLVIDPSDKRGIVVEVAKAEPKLP